MSALVLDRSTAGPILPPGARYPYLGENLSNHRGYEILSSEIYCLLILDKTSSFRIPKDLIEIKKQNPNSDFHPERHITITIRNPEDEREKAKFTIRTKDKYNQFDNPPRPFKTESELCASFIHPTKGETEFISSTVDGSVRVDWAFDIFKDFVKSAQTTFEEWNEIRRKNAPPPLPPFLHVPRTIIFTRKDLSAPEIQSAPLAKSPQEMRLMLQKVSDFVLAHASKQRNSLIGISRHPAELGEIREPIPQSGTSLDNILQVLRRDVYPNNLDEGHPRFFDYVPVAPNPVSVLSHLISAGVNPFVGSWAEASGSTQLELQTIDWIRQLVGFPPEGGGLFLNGGSESNMHGVRIGRKILLDDNPLKTQNAVIYTSGQINSSAYKGLQTLGFNIHDPNFFKELPVDNDFRLSVRTLEEAIKKDKQEGRLPFCVISNFGTTGTGAIDPISEISDICKRENLWLHVDAAYGGGFITSQKFRSDFERIGINKADSLVINPHKAMFTTYGNSLLLVRDSSWLKKTYEGKSKSSFLGDYKETEVNFYECSPHFTRNDRQALELWMAIKYYGINEFGRAIDTLSDLAGFASEEIKKDSRLKLVTGPNLSIVTFKYNFDGLSIDEQNKLNASIREDVNKIGFANIGTTLLNGETVLRMCFINPQTTEDDIKQTIELVKKIGGEIAPTIKR